MKKTKFNTRCLEENMMGHQGLVVAIIRNAIQDYADAYKRWLVANHSGKKSLMRNADIHKYRMGEVERFFRGEWYHFLCNIDPEIMLTAAKEKGEKAFNKWLEENKKNQK